MCKKNFYFLSIISLIYSIGYGQDTDCFGITPGQVLEVSESIQNGDTIGSIDYCSAGEWKKIEAEFFSTLALKENGQLYTWGINSGYNWASLIGGVDPAQQIVFDPYLVKDPLDPSQDFIVDDVSASITAAFAIRSDDKSLWSWGFDQDCSLGQGYNENAVYPNKIEQREPHLVDDTNTWKAVATSNSGGNAIDTNGQLWGWGYGDGQWYTNHGFSETICEPTLVNNDTDWKSLACGSLNTYLIKEDGTLWVMGADASGSTGQGYLNNTNQIPGIQQIGSDQDWIHVSAYGVGAVAVKSNGNLYAWGENNGGRMGLDPYVEGNFSLNVPTQIAGSEGIIFTHADIGWKSATAVDENGNYYGWGENLSGHLGTGDITTYQEFTLIDTGGIAMKYSSTAGRTSGLITSNGSLRMYGGNDTGQLGYGEEASTNPNTPVKIELGPQLENKTIAKYDASSHSQAVLTSEGELYAWGDNENGRLGVGHFDRIKENYFPNKIGDENDIWTDFWHCGGNFYAVKDNKLYGAGEDNYDHHGLGQGLGNNGNKAEMTEIPGFDMSEIKQWTCTWVGIIAIKNNGELWGFGANWVGQLGIGPQQQVEITRNTIDLNGDGLGGINSVNNVSAADANRSIGEYFTTNFSGSENGNGAEFRITTDENGFSDVYVTIPGDGFADGELIIISDNDIGEGGATDLTFTINGVGDNNGTAAIPSFQKLHPDNDWEIIYDTKGSDVTFVEKTDGSIWVCGKDNANFYQELGYPNYDGNGFVEAFSTGNDWNMFTTGNNTVLGIKDDGTLWSIGANANGLRGLGTFENTSTAWTQIGTDTDWTHANINGPSAFAVKTDGSMWSWGSGWAGQLGNGTFGNANTPTKVSGDIDWERSVGGWNLQTALAKDGTIYGWGYNRLGSIGGLGEVKSEYLDWTTDLSIIEGAFNFSDVGYVVVNDNSVLDYESLANEGEKPKNRYVYSENLTMKNTENAPAEITISLVMSDGINTSEPENVLIKINNVNEAPTDISLETLSFDENNEVNFQLSNIIITDPDFNDSHTVTIDQTYGNYDKFDIIDGFLTVSTTVSYDEFQSLDVKLIATDAGELSFTKTFNITVNNTLSFNNSLHSNFKIIPNPFNEKITITFDSFNINDAYEISIFDLSGKRIFSNYLTENNYDLNLKEIRSGIYILKLKSNKKIVTKRIIKK